MNLNEYLNKFQKFTEDPTLEAMEFIMNKFGNPHKNIQYVHVAGTNGKGSYVEMLNSVLMQAGYKVRKICVTTSY